MWLSVRTQWRSGGLGVVGLDYDSVEREAERQGVELREESGAFNRCLWRKIKALEAYELKRMSEKNESNSSVDRDKEIRKKFNSVPTLNR